MVSACFERAGFSLYGCDWIGCVPGGTLISKGWVQRACTVIQFERGKKILVLYECRAESVDNARIPTESVQSKVYPGVSSVLKAEEKIGINSRADIEVQWVSSGESSVALGS